jgi:hypothetical protein
VCAKRLWLVACRPLVFSGVGASRPPGGGSLWGPGLGPLYALDKLVRACASSPKISWGGHQILPIDRPWPQMQVHAPAAGVAPPASSVIFPFLERPRSLNFYQSATFLQFSWVREVDSGQELHFLCGILVRGNYVTNRCPQARQV